MFVTSNFDLLFYGCGTVANIALSKPKKEAPTFWNLQMLNNKLQGETSVMQTESV